MNNTLFNNVDILLLETVKIERNVSSAGSRYRALRWWCVHRNKSAILYDMNHKYIEAAYCEFSFKKVK